MVLHDGSALVAPLRYGDSVVVYESRDAMRHVTLTRGGSYRSKHGSFSHDGWVASQATFGSRVTGEGGRGYVHLLRPTPELWTRVLRHRTQILYTTDVTNIVAGLQLRPGGVVLETGTGSGSLTTSLARAVAPHGRVFTFEFHAERAQAARYELRDSVLRVVLGN
jgi:tRNA (adenine57-N1/adenine58-N1)-methyltransferase catalytic subunit